MDQLNMPVFRPAAGWPKPTEARLARSDRTMLFAVTGLQGCPVEGSDGRVGTVKDFLFDDQSWKVRWMVVDTGHWLPGRQILIHPSAIAPLDLALPAKRVLPMMTRGDTLVVSVHLTQQQIEASPEAREDEPVTKQMEADLYDYYGWDPYWGATHFGANAIVTPGSEPPIVAEAAARQVADTESHPGDGDPHLRSVTSVNGYQVHATDGELGHVENFLADDANWDIRYLVIATRDWWPGKHVQLAPYAVKEIDWFEHHIKVNVTRDQVKSSPAWDPLAMADQVGERQLHRHFGWPGYGWQGRPERRML
jgi:hypothetical protein